MDDVALRQLFVTCSNSGRWGPEDERGTLNLIDDDTRRRAAGLVREGFVVALGRAWPMDGSTVAAHPVVHRMLLSSDPTSAVDSLEITPHDPQITHVDALGHVFFEGRAYNGRAQTDVQGSTGLRALSVGAMSPGILTRGVLLDVCRARSVPWLEADDVVGVEDLERAEDLAGVRVGRGDAVVVHVGRAERVAAQERSDHPVPRAGVEASVMPWLHQREVAVFLGDCTERLPAQECAVPLPLHQIGIVAMGLCLVDGSLTSELVAACERFERREFLLSCPIPEVPGATGVPVAPMAVF